MSLKYNKKLISRAKEMRKNMTPCEKRLWYEFLRDYPVRFQRQKTIDNYIVDFYCHKAKLVIELDGNSHFTKDGIEYDKVRNELLEGYGLETIRFSNNDVEKHFSEICEEIERKVKERLDP